MRYSPRSLLQYFCSKCGSILKEVTEQIDHLSAKEECPKCGALLLETLQQKTENTSLLPPTAIEEEQPQISTRFQTAYQQFYDNTINFAFDVQQIDALLNLNACGSLCILGEQKYTQLLIDRLCVHILLPRRYRGMGLDCSKIIVIDAGNCSDVYQSVDFARQYGLEVKKVLQNILVSRVFSIYQLANMMIYELPRLVQQLTSSNNVIVISDMLHMFVSDPHVDTKEAKDLLKQIARSIKKMSEDGLVIVSSARCKEYEKLLLPTFNKHIKITNDNSYNTNDNALQMKIFNKHTKKESSAKIVRLKERELVIIPPR